MAEQAAQESQERAPGRVMRVSGPLVVAEGYMDVIALALAGFEGAVAPLGTAITEDQLRLMWRVSPEPIITLDGDAAGQRAAMRLIDMALPLAGPGQALRFALMPGGQDPDDLVKAGGPEAFREVLAQARPLAELLWLRETAGGVFDTPERRADLEKRLRELAGRIRDESVRRHYQQDMRERVNAFFGSARAPRRDDRQGSRGPAGQGGSLAAGRLAVSDSLARSALFKSGGGLAAQIHPTRFNRKLTIIHP